MSDDNGGCRDHEKVEKELRETPPSGAEPSEGGEVWLNGKDAQEEPAQEERRSSWWSRIFGG